MKNPKSDHPIFRCHIIQDSPHLIAEMVEGSSDDALEVLQTVIENLLDAVRNDATKFRNSVAPLTGAISLLLHRECEEYGMTKEL